MHKILLNSVLLSPIVSGVVRQNPLINNPCLLPFVGQLGSGPRLVGRIGPGVRVSVSFQQKYPPGSVLRQQKTGVMTRGQGFFKDQYRTAQSSNCMASAEREPITGVWGRSPQRVQGQSPRWGSRGEASLKLNAFLFLHVQSKLQICPIIDICKSQKIAE